MGKKNEYPSEVPEKFDDALHELRGLMEMLESDEISVDTLTQAIRRAALLLKHCQTQLHATEAEVKALMDELGVQSSGADSEERE
ncbi:MAG: exodeoxyribonuclease VII small subunit [Bacteroidetes bacterium]|nr:exodeoxyribonuclease VII small subunit [Bacteroidota bacterium]MDA1335742.1 exodeoxyribonuclease VII small subunit [Bacteroidota bacterium]